MVYVLHLSIWILFLILALFIIEFLCLLPATHAMHGEWEELPIPDVFLKDEELTVQEVFFTFVGWLFLISELLGKGRVKLTFYFFFDVVVFDEEFFEC